MEIDGQLAKNYPYEPAYLPVARLEDAPYEIRANSSIKESTFPAYFNGLPPPATPEGFRATPDSPSIRFKVHSLEIPLSIEAMRR